MNLQGIFHQPKSNYCFAYDKNNIELRLRAAKDDLTKVSLIYGDKYDFENVNKVEMKRSFSDSLYDYFIATIKAPSNRLSYYFVLESGEEKRYFTEWGPLERIDMDEIHLHFFNYPYINEADIHKVPEWVKDAVFYQIFPERFANGDISINPKKVESWGGKPTRENFFGGDLKGIIEKIDYLKELGINAIYLTPIFESTTSHKYNTTDYMKIDPHFGDKETLKELVSKCHKKGIKVVLDAVFNHCGYDFAGFKDVVEKGKKSGYYDWFYINEWPIKIKKVRNNALKDEADDQPSSYETFGFEPAMPKLNTANKGVKKYILDVAKYWIKECDIDGWRLDVANEVDHELWRDFRKAVKETKKDAYILGEIWHDALPWLRGDQFDATMNYPVTRACLQYFAYSKMEAEGFRELISNTLMRNTKQVNEVMLNLLDSHDTARFLTECKGDARKLLLADTFLLTFVGTLSIYYGTEIGMEGENDPDCRRTMEWNRDNWNMELFNSYKELIHIRLESEALRRGSFKWIGELKDVVGYVRETKKEKVMVLINNSDNVKKVKVKVKESGYLDLLDKKDAIIPNNEISITMDKYTAKILRMLI